MYFGVYTDRFMAVHPVPATCVGSKTQVFPSIFKIWGSDFFGPVTFQINWPPAVFEPGRDFATLSRFLFECRTKINHPRHHVATTYEMSRV